MGQGTLVNHQVVAVQHQLLSAEQAAAAQQQTHIAWGEPGRIVDHGNGIAASLELNFQDIQMLIQPT